MNLSINVFRLLSGIQDRPSSNSQKSISESSENLSQPRPMKTKQNKKEENEKFMDTKAFHSALENNPEVIENWNQVENWHIASDKLRQRL